MTLEDQIRRYAQEARALLLSQAGQQAPGGIAEWIGYSSSGKGLVRQNGRTREVNVIGNISLKKGQLVLLDANDTIQVMDLPPREQPRRAERRQDFLVSPPFKKKRSIILSTLFPQELEEGGDQPIIEGDYMVSFIDTYNGSYRTLYVDLGGINELYEEWMNVRGPVIQTGFFDQTPGYTGKIARSYVEHKTVTSHIYYAINKSLPRNPDPVIGGFGYRLPTSPYPLLLRSSTKDKTYLSYYYVNAYTPRTNTVFQVNGDIIYNTYAAVGNAELHGVYITIDNLTSAITKRDETLTTRFDIQSWDFYDWSLAEQDLFYASMDPGDPLKISYDNGANNTFLNSNPYANVCYNPDTGKAVILEKEPGATSPALTEWRLWTKSITPELALLTGLAIARAGDTSDGTWTLEHSFVPAGFQDINTDSQSGEAVASSKLEVMVSAF